MADFSYEQRVGKREDADLCLSQENIASLQKHGSHQGKAQLILLNCSKLLAMSTTKTRKRKVKQAPKGVAVYKKMIEDKKTIRKHLEKGGTFKELKEKGYHFATV